MLYFQTRIVQTNQVQRNRNKEKRIRNEIINLIFKTYVIINTFMSITFYLCRLELNFLFSFIFLKIHMEIHMDSKLSIWKSIWKSIWIQYCPYGNQSTDPIALTKMTIALMQRRTEMKKTKRSNGRKLKMRKRRMIKYRLNWMRIIEIGDHRL